MRKIDREKSANAVRAIHAHLFASNSDVVPAAAGLVPVPRKQPNWCAVVDVLHFAKRIWQKRTYPRRRSLSGMPFLRNF
jgi:hypothetical protein